MNSAVTVEHAFLGFFDDVQTRSETYDADFVRSAKPKYLGETLKRAADRLAERAGRANLTHTQKEQILFGVDDIRSGADILIQHGEERRDSTTTHWRVAAGFIRVLDNVLPK